MKRLLSVGVGLWLMSGTAWAVCEVHTSNRTYADGELLNAEVCDSTGAVKVSGAGGGTQYTEGDTDATIVGTAIMWEDAANTLTPVNTSKPLPVQGTVTVTDGAGALNVIIDSGSSTADTEMPAAAALADNTANPTVPGVAAFLMCYDGSTWDRCQGGLTDTDDGSIAASQVPSLVVNLNHAFNGTAWLRQGYDPCSGPKTVYPVNIGSAATTEIVNGAGASNHIYVCSMFLQTDAANDVALVDDDTDACASPGTGGSGLIGGTSAATGANLTAGGGWTLGNGLGTVAKTGGTNRYVCLITSAATQLSGVITYVTAP